MFTGFFKFMAVFKFLWKNPENSAPASEPVGPVWYRYSYQIGIDVEQNNLKNLDT